MSPIPQTSLLVWTFVHRFLQQTGSSTYFDCRHCIISVGYFCVVFKGPRKKRSHKYVLLYLIFITLLADDSGRIEMFGFYLLNSPNFPWGEETIEEN